MLLKIKGKNNATKVLKKWINNNAFNIHEYVESKDPEIYAKLLESLNLILARRRGKINVNLSTPFGEKIELKFKPESKYSHPQYTLLISPKPTKHPIHY